jgi:hypothetical protein
MIIYHDVEQGTPEWHALRKDLWTGSKAIRLLQGKSNAPRHRLPGEHPH